MAGETVTEQRTYEGLGTYESPFNKLPGISLTDFTEQLWREHGQEIRRGRKTTFSVGMFRYAIVGDPDEKEIVFQLSMFWEGFDPSFRSMYPEASQISEQTKNRRAVDYGIAIYRRFLSLHLRSFFTP
jgi:hypothetical protein